MIKKIIALLGELWGMIRVSQPGEHETGVTTDPRSDEEKQKDYLHEETAFQAAPVYGNMITQSPYPYENQLGTSSCLPHGVTLAWGIAAEAAGKFIRLSKMFVYRNRSNYPDPGMYFQEPFEILRKQGSCLFDTLPTPPTETAANAMVITSAERAEALSYMGLEYYQSQLPEVMNDIDTLATLASQGYAVPILLYSTYQEWAQMYPQTTSNVTKETAEVRHCVSILPRSGFIMNGKKYVVVQDSAWFGGYKLRYLSEDFIKARVYGMGYWKQVAIKAAEGAKPVHTFHYPMSLGDQSEEVRWLQKCLIYEGLLPADCATGLFAGRTRKAVSDFQTKYAADILIPLHLSAPTGVAGTSTLKKLNALYAV